jgi:hypothetical protein
MDPAKTRVERHNWKKQEGGGWGAAEEAKPGFTAGEHAKAMGSHYFGEQYDATEFRGSVEHNDKTLRAIKENYGKVKDRNPKRGTAQYVKQLGKTGPMLGDDEHVGSVTTRYMDADSQALHATTVQNGKLVGSDGKHVDTTEATGFGGYGARTDELAGRHIYAMDEQGSMRTADAWKEARLGRKEGDKAVELAYANHSSLLAGDRAAGAGEMRVEQGEVKVVSDNSGHYKPDAAMMHQTVGRLADLGVGLEGMSTEFVDKTDDHKTSLANAGDGFKTGVLSAGALEMMSYAGDSQAESKMRGARAERTDMMSDIRGFDRSKLRAVADDEKSDRSAPNLALGSEPKAPRQLGSSILDRIAKLKRAGLALDEEEA